MKQDSEPQSYLSATESQEDKKHHIQKKRIIRKERNSNKDIQNTTSTAKLTKQDRARIQKQKNRQAAQRSRDLHKEYVNNLERQVNDLRNKLENSIKYCSKCQKQLDNYTQDFFNSEPSYVQRQFQSQKYLFQPNNHEHQYINQEQPEQFMRLQEPQSSSSFVKMLLLVCMVAIAVAIGISHTGQSSSIPGRSLIQNFNMVPQKDIQNLNELTTPKQSFGLVQINRKLDNQMCLDSLVSSKQQKISKSLRSIHNNHIIQPSDGILLCSLRKSKGYNIVSDKIQSPLVKIFVLGSQIKQVLSQSGPLLRLLDSNIQLNGIYRLDAQIKNVDLVSHHNCLV